MSQTDQQTAANMLRGKGYRVFTGEDEANNPVLIVKDPVHPSAPGGMLRVSHYQCVTLYRCGPSSLVQAAHNFLQARE